MTVRPELTVPQAQAIISALVYALAGEEYVTTVFGSGASADAGRRALTALALVTPERS